MRQGTEYARAGGWHIIADGWVGFDDADDVIIVNLGIDDVIRLSTQGVMTDPAEDDDSRPGPAGASSRPPRARRVGSVKDGGSS
jgi:hypothetical protein